MSAGAPFFFDCHRCGLCCRAGHGRVWLEEEEIAPLAAARGATPAAFVQHFVANVAGRASLRERADGSCMLLEDGNRCTAYAARPAQCRSFPFWPGVLDDPAEQERVAALCPGIQRLPTPAQWDAALVWLAQDAAAEFSPVQQSDDAFAPMSEGERWGCSLEADLFLAGHALPAAAMLATSDARRRRLERVAGRLGYPWSVGPWQRLLADRARAWQELRGGVRR